MSDLTTAKRTLFNWVMSGVVSSADAKQLILDGKVPEIKKGKMPPLISFSQLRTWKVV
jgi:hypothetical protein